MLLYKTMTLGLQLGGSLLAYAESVDGYMRSRHNVSCLMGTNVAECHMKLFVIHLDSLDGRKSFLDMNLVILLI